MFKSYFINNRSWICLKISFLLKYFFSLNRKSKRDVFQLISSTQKFTLKIIWTIPLFKKRGKISFLYSYLPLYNIINKFETNFSHKDSVSVFIWCLFASGKKKLSMQAKYFQISIFSKVRAIVPYSTIIF